MAKGGHSSSVGATDPPEEGSMPHIYWTKEAAVGNEDTPPPIPPRQRVPLHLEQPPEQSGSTDPPEEGSMPHIYWTMETSTAVVSETREQPPEQSGPEQHYYWTLVTGESTHEATPLDEDGYAIIADPPLRRLPSDQSSTTDDAGYEILPHLRRRLPCPPPVAKQPSGMGGYTADTTDFEGYSIVGEGERTLYITSGNQKRIMSSFAIPGTAPSTPADAIRWFREVEAPKGVGREKDGSISPWFHGLCDRERAEKLLEDKPVGSYLVRLSTRVWGYTISVRMNDEQYTHLLVDVSSGQYHLLGSNTNIALKTLNELLNKTLAYNAKGQCTELTDPIVRDDDSREFFEGLFNDIV